MIYGRMSLTNQLSALHPCGFLAATRLAPADVPAFGIPQLFLSLQAEDNGCKHGERSAPCVCQSAKHSLFRTTSPGGRAVAELPRSPPKHGRRICLARVGYCEGALQRQALQQRCNLSAGEVAKTFLCLMDQNISWICYKLRNTDSGFSVLPKPSIFLEWRMEIRARLHLMVEWDITECIQLNNLTTEYMYHTTKHSVSSCYSTCTGHSEEISL